MLLGLSSLDGDAGAGVGAIGGSGHGDDGVADGELLARFAEAVHAVAHPPQDPGDSTGGEPGGGEPAVPTDPAAIERRLTEVRAEVEATVGPAGLVDAAAVCANFNMMVRIADGTGTPLDAGTVAMSADTRAQLDLDELVSRRVADA